MHLLLWFFSYHSTGLNPFSYTLTLQCRRLLSKDLSLVWEKVLESLCDVNYVDIQDIYLIICRQVQRNLNTYKWPVMGVPPIEILILIVFSHLGPLTTEWLVVVGGGGGIHWCHLNIQLNASWLKIEIYFVFAQSLLYQIESDGWKLHWSAGFQY